MIDRGWNKTRRILVTPRRDILVGVQGREGSRKHVAPETDTTSSALESVDTETGEITTGGGSAASVADVAAINEFGMGVPERSFLRSTIDAGRGKYAKLLRGIGQAMVAGKISPSRGAALVGEIVVGDIKQTIADGVPPPNAESTIVAKGSSTPLIASGQLRGAITYRVKTSKSLGGQKR